MVVRKRSSAVSVRPKHLRRFDPAEGVDAASWAAELLLWAEAKNVEAFGSIEAALEVHRREWPLSLRLAPGMVD